MLSVKTKIISEEKVHEITRWILAGVFAGGILFLVVLSIAMIIYPGGWKFFDYYISDLGRTVAINGDPNPDSPKVFMLAMIIGALSLGAFWFFSEIVLRPSTGRFKWLVQLGSVLGLVSSPFMAAIPFFPVDTMHTEHITVGVIFFVCVALALILYSSYFIINFFRGVASQFRLFYVALIGLVVFAVSAIVVVLLEDLPLPLLAASLFVMIALIFVLHFKFTSAISYVSFLLAVFVFTLIGAIVGLVIGGGVTAILEISFVYGMIVWLLAENLQVMGLNQQTS